MMDGLPIEVVYGGILPFLSLKELKALDVAVTNHNHRQQFLTMWNSYQYDHRNIEITYEELSWLHMRSVQIHVIKASVTEERLVEFMSMNLSTYLTELYLPNTGQLTDSMIQTISSCNQLEVVHLPLGKYTDVGITALVRNCRKLRSISLKSSRVTNKAILAICDYCPHLQHIDVSNCHKLSDSIAFALATTYPYLQSVKARCCRFTDEMLCLYADKCRQLQSIAINGPHITRNSLSMLWPVNPNLTDVDISCNKYVYDDDLLILAQSCPQLRALDIRNCFNVTDAAIIAVAEHCPQLTSLNICFCNNISDIALIALGQYCHGLKVIDLCYVKNISDVGVSSLATGCPLLQEILSNTCQSVTELGISVLAHSCRWLERVCLFLNTNSGFNAVYAIAVRCPMITELSLLSCCVDDRCLLVVAENCRNLTILRLSASPNIAEAVLRHIITSCSMLEVIALKNYKMYERDSFERLKLEYPRMLITG